VPAAVDVAVVVDVDAVAAEVHAATAASSATAAACVTLPAASCVTPPAAASSVTAASSVAAASFVFASSVARSVGASLTWGRFYETLSPVIYEKKIKIVKSVCAIMTFSLIENAFKFKTICRQQSDEFILGVFRQKFVQNLRLKICAKNVSVRNCDS
jgi:hypothetical protein